MAKCIKIALLFFFVTSTSLVNAQGKFLNKFYQDYRHRIGIELGPSISIIEYVNTFDYYDESHITSFSGGVYYKYNFLKFLSVRSGLYYEQRGAKSEFYGHAISRHYFRTLDHSVMSLPIQLGIEFGGNFKFSFSAGTHFGYKIKKIETKDYLYDEEYPVVRDYVDDERPNSLYAGNIQMNTGVIFHVSPNLLLTSELKMNWVKRSFETSRFSTLQIGIAKNIFNSNGG